jgi:hypothetical protein
MTQFEITAAQEAAFNAAGEAMIDFGKISLTYEGDEPQFFVVTGRVRPKTHSTNSYDYASAAGDTAAEALRAFAAKANEIIAQPAALDAAAMKQAVAEIVDDARTDLLTNGLGRARVALDTAADRIAALKVAG